MSNGICVFNGDSSSVCVYMCLMGTITVACVRLCVCFFSTQVVLQAKDVVQIFSLNEHVMYNMFDKIQMLLIVQ